VPVPGPRWWAGVEGRRRLPAAGPVPRVWGRTRGRGWRPGAPSSTSRHLLPPACRAGRTRVARFRPAGLDGPGQLHGFPLLRIAI